MPDIAVTIKGVRVPRFLYGTAWKEEETQRLTRLAIEAGFRGIDTANQRRHYHEVGVGGAIRSAIHDGIVKRDELFLQTKFTSQAGQDHRLPFDPHAPIALQVEQSFASSLEHLGVSSLDSYVLHGPTRRVGLGRADWEAWRAMEAIFASGGTRFLGVSNVSLGQLEELCDRAEVQPTFVQNRCYANRGWDRSVRAFCAAHSMFYQGFSLLTANREVLAHPELVRIARKHQCGVGQAIFRFALDVGMIPLTGTTNPQHMRDDLAVFGFRLDPDEIDRIDHVFPA